MGILDKLLGLSREKPPTINGKDIDEGVRLLNEGRYEEAEGHLRALTVAHPESTVALYNYGAALLFLGRAEDALSAFDQAIHLDRKCWPALINAASIRVGAGDHGRAIKDFRNASDPKDMTADATLMYARCLLTGEQFSEAFLLLKPQIHRLHSMAIFWLYFAISCQFLGLVLEATSALKKAKSLDPDSINEGGRLGLLLTESGRYGEARSQLTGVIKKMTGSDQDLISFARLQEVMGSKQRALKLYELILQRSNSSVEALTNLGNLKKQTGDYTQAELMYRRGLSLNMKSPILHKNLSNLLGVTLRAEEATSELNQSVSLAPQNPYHFSDLLFAQQYSANIRLDDHKKAAMEWGRRFVRPSTDPSVKAKPAEHRPLRIGLISGSFRQHPVGFLALPGLEALERSKFSIYCYANQVDCDAYTERFRNLSERWRPVAHLPDQQLRDTILEDEIDILVEMSGHAAGHRLPVVARRLAPVQVKWVGGQFNTLGIDTMDYFLSDHVETPAKYDTAFVEQVYRLPNVYACYEPPKGASDVSPLPAMTANTITFGSLNKANKTTPSTIALWSQCLNAVPKSRLILKGDSFNHEPTCDYARSLFAGHGVAPERIELRGFTAHPKLLETYNEIDIALDPTPYSGCLTTCEALFMGVPVLTLPGETFAGRHSASFLTAVGLEDWIVNSEQNYVDTLISMCQDLGALKALRRSLRQRMLASPLCDTTRFGDDLGEALLAMWNEKRDAQMATA